MNALDIALVVIVAASVITAAVRGFLYEIWMMVAALAAVALAAWKYPAVSSWFEWIPSNEARDFASFVLILAVVLIIAAIIGRTARGAVRAIGLGGMDRFLGACLGLVRGWILGVAVVAMLTACAWRPALISQSRLAPAFLWGARALVQVLPGDLDVRFHAGLASL